MFRLFVVKARLVFAVRLTITQWKIFRKFPERLSVLPVENGTIIPRLVFDRFYEAKSKVDGLKRIKVDFSSEKTAQLKSEIRSNFRPSICGLSVETTPVQFHSHWGKTVHFRLDIRSRKPWKCKCVKNNCKQPKLFGKEALAVGGTYKCEHDDDSSVAKEKNMKKVTNFFARLLCSNWILE